MRQHQGVGSRRAGSTLTRAIDSYPAEGCVGGCAPNTKPDDGEREPITPPELYERFGLVRLPDLAAARRGRRRDVLSESRMREICMSGSMRRERKRIVWQAP